MTDRSDFTIERACLQALHWHAGQVDKQGEPYILHSLRVMLDVSERAQIVAVLHDVLEDTNATAEYFDEYLDRTDLGALLLVTRRDGESYRDYINRIWGACGPDGEIAREVKVADIRDNLARMPFTDEWASLRGRYQSALKVLAPIGPACFGESLCR